MTHELTHFAVVDADCSTVYAVGDTAEDARERAIVLGGAIFKRKNDQELIFGYVARGPVLVRCTTRFADYFRSIVRYSSDIPYASLKTNWTDIGEGIDVDASRNRKSDRGGGNHDA